MLEDTKNVGAISASSSIVLDLKDPTQFNTAPFLKITAIDGTNNSQAAVTLRVNGREYTANRGTPFHIEPGGRIEILQITTDANAVNSGEIKITCKGNRLPFIQAA